MRKLSKYEKETIINWNEGETIASIYTFNASLKRRLADFSRKYPLLCRLERSTPEGSVTYVLDFRSGWCRRTAKNGWQLPESTLNNMVFRFCVQKRKAPDYRANDCKMPGLHPAFSQSVYSGVSSIQYHRR